MITRSRELKYQARVILSEKAGFLALLTFLITAIDFGLNYVLSYAFPMTDGIFSLVLYYGCGILCHMVYYILLAGLARIYLNICRRNKVKLFDLYYFFSGRTEQIAIYAVIQYALSTASAYAFDWIGAGLFGSSGTTLILYAVTGLILAVISIWIQLCLALVLYLYCDAPDKSVLELIKESWSLMRGRKLAMFWLELSFLGLAVLCALSLGIGYLFVRPYLILAQTLFYLSLKRP